MTSNWSAPNFSRSKIDAAGRLLASAGPLSFEVLEAYQILNNWRASHGFPLNTLQMALRRKATALDTDSLIAQRLKRVPSIVAKLQRFPSMNLSRMQDIGGCRAVVGSVDIARRVRVALLESNFKHKLVGEKDYISLPKESGYRSLHLVYRYKSDKSVVYNNHHVEVQIRTQVQHAWATAVETVGTIVDQALKASQGSRDWLRFFSLAGDLFADLEGTPRRNTEISVAKLVEDVRRMTDALKVREKLRGFRLALKTIEQDRKMNRYFLLTLRPDLNTVEVHGYTYSQFSQATRDYLERERELACIPGAEAVLVAAGPIDALRRAYPNYFMDTARFLEHLNLVTGTLA